MNKAQVLIIFFVVVITGLYLQTQSFKKKKKNYDFLYVDDPEALCLDGTRAAFYFAEGSGSGKDKFLFYFQGGGWIGGSHVNDTLESAYKRSLTVMGSSVPLSRDFDGKGIFSRKQNENPEFHNWNSIFINYCSGTGHQGYRKEPMTFNQTNIYFRGETITKGILKQLQKDKDLDDAKIVLVSGCSAGGLATYTWVQYIRDQLSSEIEVLAAPDSGLFLDMDPLSEEFVSYRTYYIQNMMELANQEVDPPNRKCIEQNPNEKWKCLMAPYLIDYIKVPIFILQANYDSWQVPYLLHIGCTSDNTFNNCTSKQIDYIEESRNILNNIVKPQLDKNSDWGAWMPSCIQHCFLELEQRFNTDTYQVPMNSGLTPSRTLGQWVNQQKTDNIHQESYPWPFNQPCSGGDKLKTIFQ